MRDYYNPIKSFCLKWDLPPFWDSGITQANMIREIIKALNAMLNENNEFVNTVNGKIIDMQKIIDDFIEMFDVDLTNTIEEKLVEWEISGKLADIINQTLFDSKVDNVVYNSKVKELEIKTKELRYNVVDGGLIGDGNFINDNVLKVILNNGYKRLLFPTGVYYFNEVPVLNGIDIVFEDNVLLSLPNNYSQNKIMDWHIKTNVKVRSRDRLGNDALVNPNNFSVVDKLTSSNDDTNQNDLTQVSLTSWKYGETEQIQSTENVVYTQGSDKYTLLSNTFTMLSYDVKNTNRSLEALVNNLGSSSIGVFVMSEDTKSFVDCFIGSTKKYINVDILRNGSYTRIYSNKIIKHIDINKSGVAWDMNVFKLMVVKTETNMFTILLNDVEIGNIKTPFDIRHIGFVSNVKDTVIEKPMLSIMKQVPVNHSINALVVGDSLSAGDGSSSNVKETLKTMLESSRGINKVNITSIVEGGTKMVDIKNTLLSTDLSSFDTVIIIGGTNDVLTNSNGTVFIESIKQIIDFSRSQNCRTIFTDIPIMTNKNDTGTGESFNGSGSLVSYQSFLKHTVAMKRTNLDDLKIANVSFETGTSFTNQANLIVEDNVHLTQRGSYALCKSIMKAYLSFTGS